MVTAQALCELLTDLDAPGRLERPRLTAPEVLHERVERLAFRLERAAGRCAVERSPAGADHHGRLTLPGPVTIVVGRYGFEVAFAAGPVLGEEQFARVKTAIHQTGFHTLPDVAALVPTRPGGVPRRVVTARSGEELAGQVARLPSTGDVGVLRDRILRALGLPVTPVDGVPEAVDPLPPHRVLVEVERVAACVAALAAGADELRWAAIDDVVLDRPGMEAIKAIRDEFHCAVGDAVERYDRRTEHLLRTRPHGMAAGTAA
ncbi:hypothetical protein ABZ816_33840 [Actinosynnema sp. NPDC047251]|uniref:hypothetical protein n=1 Tax=Saccharothrix espanaensis TaxID=103731 RepID=UPI00059B778A|nr:hypothetical protein [Saccharothrix espanaensis]